MHSVILAMPYVYVTKPFVGQMSWKIKLIKLSYALQLLFIGYGHVRSVIKQWETTFISLQNSSHKSQFLVLLTQPTTRKFFHRLTTFIKKEMVHLFLTFWKKYFLALSTNFLNKRVK